MNTSAIRLEHRRFFFDPVEVKPFTSIGLSSPSCGRSRALCAPASVAVDSSAPALIPSHGHRLRRLDVARPRRFSRLDVISSFLPACFFAGVKVHSISYQTFVSSAHCVGMAWFLLLYFVSTHWAGMAHCVGSLYQLSLLLYFAPNSSVGYSNKKKRCCLHNFPPAP